MFSVQTPQPRQTIVFSSSWPDRARAFLRQCSSARIKGEEMEKFLLRILQDLEATSDEGFLAKLGLRFLDVEGLSERAASTLALQVVRALGNESQQPFERVVVQLTVQALEQSPLTQAQALEVQRLACTSLLRSERLTPLDQALVLQTFSLDAVVEPVDAMLVGRTLLGRLGQSEEEPELPQGLARFALDTLELLALPPTQERRILERALLELASFPSCYEQQATAARDAYIASREVGRAQEAVEVQVRALERIAC